MKKVDLLKLLAELNDDDEIVLNVPYSEMGCTNEIGIEEDYETQISLEPKNAWELVVPLKDLPHVSMFNRSYTILVDSESVSKESINKVAEKCKGVFEPRKVFCLS